ncbi:MAG: hypothetical protein RI897_3568 [Verrucomicrobiota bacterium]
MKRMPASRARRMEFSRKEEYEGLPQLALMTCAPMEVA